MSRHLSLAFSSAMIVYGLSIVFVPSALAGVNCDVGKCIDICSKGKTGTSLQVCNSWCQLTINDRKKSGQCK
jgi:hypothetical protein